MNGLLIKNVWNKRRENNTTNAGKTVERKKRENIVEIDTGFLTEDEKQIEIDGELIPYSISQNGKVRNLRTGKFLKGSVAAREIGILPGSMRNTIRRNGKCHNGLSYHYLDK